MYDDALPLVTILKEAHPNAFTPGLLTQLLQLLPQALSRGAWGMGHEAQVMGHGVQDIQGNESRASTDIARRRRVDEQYICRHTLTRVQWTLVSDLFLVMTEL